METTELEDGISPNGTAGVYFDGIDDAMKLDNVSLNFPKATKSDHH